ncbi:hypothetical protein ALC152_05160 [Arcobacter sp. 15-2]|uniref:hypothetical protein n=1 Tax=Arcobacter sp. 15-2 TaxID=3374109 RepID=UPI00399C9227
MEKLSKNKIAYRAIFFKQDETIDVQKTERFDELIEAKQLGTIECNELNSLASELGGSFYLDDLRNEVLDLVEYHQNQIRIINGIGYEYD